MSNVFLACNAVTTGNTTEILSPSIGRAQLFVSVGHVIMPSQVIGEFWRLSRHFTLIVPDHCTGKIISIKDHDRILNVAFGEPLFLLGEIAEPSRKVAYETKRDSLNESKNLAIDAPMDGMFYLSASPQDPPFVKVGDVISPGQTVGLIEVMKSFYPLKYQGVKTATIVSIAVKNAVPVTSGMKLYVLNI